MTDKMETLLDTKIFKAKPLEEKVRIVTNLFLSNPKATIRTIAAHCSLSTRTVHIYLTQKLQTLDGTEDQVALVQARFSINKGFVTDPLKVQRIQAVAAATIDGRTQPQIATELGISLSTVRNDSSPARTSIALSHEEAKLVTDNKATHSRQNLKINHTRKGKY